MNDIVELAHKLGASTVGGPSLTVAERHRVARILISYVDRDMKDRYEAALAAREKRIMTLTAAISEALAQENTMTGSAHDRSLRVVADRDQKMEAILRAALGEGT